MPANPPTKQAARLPKMPKARVMITNAHGVDPKHHYMEAWVPMAITPHGKPTDSWPHSVAVIPCHKPSQARALIRVAGFFAMGEGERVEAAAKALWEQGHYLTHPMKFKWHEARPIQKASWQASARAVLTLIASGGARK